MSARGCTSNVSNMSNVSSDGGCTVFDSNDKCDIILGVGRAIAIISLISCIYNVIVIIALKRYKFLPQRLILYLNISVFFYTIQYTWVDYRITGGFCKFQAWYSVLIAWINYLWVSIIIFNIALMTWFRKRLDGWKYDVVYWAVAVIPAVIISVIPFPLHAYGPTGIWCWIVTEKNGDNYAVGIALEYAIYYGPWIFMCIMIMVVLLAVVFVMKNRLQKATASMKGHSGPQPGTDAQEKFQKEQITPLLPYPAIVITTVIFFVINKIRLQRDFAEECDSAIHLLFWLVVALTLPLRGFLLALVITFDKETLRGLKDVMTKCCRKQGDEENSEKADDYLLYDELAKIN